MRGAAVKAESPAKRGRSEAKRLDGGEHTPKLSVGRCPGHHNILGSVPARIDRFHAFGNSSGNGCSFPGAPAARSGRSDEACRHLPNA